MHLSGKYTKNHFALRCMATLPQETGQLALRDLGKDELLRKVKFMRTILVSEDIDNIWIPSAFEEKFKRHCVRRKSLKVKEAET